MAEDRSQLEALDELVTGGDWKRDGNTESRPYPVRRAWFRRCCGKRMYLMGHRFRAADARNFPANSRRAEQWWGGGRWWECKSCGYIQQAPGSNRFGCDF